VLVDEPLYQVDVEQRLDVLGDRLMNEVERFAVLTVERAEAESDYKRRYHRALLQQASGTVAQREAMAQLKTADQFRSWKIVEAQEKATQQALIALRTQIEATRTISANVRAAGG
jgi:hypothetical protein